MTEINQRNKLVVKSNTLIESKYHLSVREQKFLIYLASLAKKDDIDYKYTSVKIKDIERALKVGDDKKWGSIYDVVRDIVMSINNKPISIRKENGGWSIINWFSSVDADPSEGLVTFELTEAIKSQLVALNEYFTKYRFGNILSLRSGYSIRIYELLKLSQFKGKIRYDLDYFRELIGVSYIDENSKWVHKYKEYKAFKRSILNHAQEELKRETDIYFELKEDREGRSVKFLTFYVFKNIPNNKTMQSELFKDPIPVVEEVEEVYEFDQSIISDFIKIGISPEKAQLLYKEGFNIIEDNKVRKQIVSNGRSLDEYFKEKIDYVNFTITKSEVNNPAGLLIKSIKENYFSKELRKLQKIKEGDQKRQIQSKHKAEQEEKLRAMRRNLSRKEKRIIDQLVNSSDDFLDQVFSDKHPELWPNYKKEKSLKENFLTAKGILRAKFTTIIKEQFKKEFVILESDLASIEKFKKQIELL